jgi:hypothetical protein
MKECDMPPGRVNDRSIHTQLTLYRVLGLTTSP